MQISLAITTKNEGHYVKTLLDYLLKFVEEKSHLTGHSYEIVVLDDYSDDPLTLYTLSYTKLIDSVHFHPLNNDFAAHKNQLIAHCKGDWILALDADEMISEDFLFNLPQFIDGNPTVEAYWLPRVNTVDGLTLAHVQQWRWVLTTLPEFIRAKIINPESEEYALLKAYDFIVSEENGFITYRQPIINFPDMQMRLFKNAAHIHWEGKVHERLTGFEHFSMFPPQVEFAIQHHKEISRQVSQNTFYDTLTR